ncbi:hypothetical protein NBRC116594_33980 [Shimia sp. NS0008-38b]
MCELWIMVWVIGELVMRHVKGAKPCERQDQWRSAGMTNRAVDPARRKWSVVGAFMAEREEENPENAQWQEGKRPQWGLYSDPQCQTQQRRQIDRQMAQSLGIGPGLQRGATGGWYLCEYVFV